MKKAIFLVCIFIVFFTCFYSFNDSYHLKVEIKLENITPIDLDENYAKNIERDILNIDGIKDVVIISSTHGINIYCKFNFFTNKEYMIGKIQRVLIPYKFDNLNFDDKYYLNYNCFVVVFLESNVDDYYMLKQKTEVIFDEILKSKISLNTKIFGLQQKVVNIYFSDDVLLKYDLTLKDLKEIIKKNNLSENLINDKTIDTRINKAEDIKNIVINFKNSNYPLKFSDIFEIKEEVKTPIDYKIYWNNKEALVIALSLKIFYPIWLLKIKLSKFNNIKVISPGRIKKTQLFLRANSNFDLLNKTYLKILDKDKENKLYFLALNSPKIHSNEHFDEILDNRIIIFSNDFKYRNTKKEIAFDELSSVRFKTDEYKMNEFNLTKEDVFDSLLQSFSGVFCGYFFNKDEKIEIYLKNVSNSIYSKKFQTLISRNEILKGDIKPISRIIVRKKIKRIDKIKIKN